MKLPSFAVKTIENQRLGFVASVTAGGRPNVSPKGTFIVLDETTIAFAEIRSPQTMTNIALMPEVEVNFIDQFTRKGVRVRGDATIIRASTENFEKLIGQWETIWGDLTKRVNAIVKIEVKSTKLLSTPPYDDGATEEEMIAIYKDKFSKMYP